MLLLTEEVGGIVWFAVVVVLSTLRLDSGTGVFSCIG